MIAVDIQFRFYYREAFCLFGLCFEGFWVPNTLLTALPRQFAGVKTANLCAKHMIFRSLPPHFILDDALTHFG